MNFTRRLLKQAKPRIWLGGARDMLQRAQSYYGALNMLMLFATLYTVREATIHKWVPWLNFPIFLAFLLTLLILIILVDHKLIYPSQIAYHQHEAWKHESPVKKELHDMEQRLIDRIDALEKIIEHRK